MFLYDEFGCRTQVMGFGGGGNSGQATETADMQAQAEINKNLWNYYQTYYQPMINTYAEKMSNSGTKTAEFNKAMGQVNESVMQNVDPTNASTNPVANAKMLGKVATIGTGASAQTQGGVRSKQLKDTQNVIDIGRGQATEAVSGIGDIASQSLTAELSDLSTQQQKSASTENAYGSTAGAVAAGLLKAGSSSGSSSSATADPTAKKSTALSFGGNDVSGLISNSSLYGF